MGLKTSYDTCQTSWHKDLFQHIQEMQTKPCSPFYFTQVQGVVMRVLCKYGFENSGNQFLYHEFNDSLRGKMFPTRDVTVVKMLQEYKTLRVIIDATEFFVQHILKNRVICTQKRFHVSSCQMRMKAAFHHVLAV